MTIDTLEYAKRLEAGGVDRKHAEIHAEALRASLSAQLATKQDLDAAIAKLDATMIKYMVGQTFAIVALVFALLRLIPH